MDNFSGVRLSEWLFRQSSVWTTIHIGDCLINHSDSLTSEHLFRQCHVWTAVQTELVPNGILSIILHPGGPFSIECPLELASQDPLWGPFWGPWWSRRAPWPLVEFHNDHKSVPTWLKGLKCIMYNVWCRNSKHSLKEARKFWGPF